MRCSRCQIDKPEDEFYWRNTTGRKGRSGYCKTCNGEYALIRLRRVKMRMIDHKGGKCQKCEIEATEENLCIFDFHHLDRSKKDPNFSKIKSKSWDKIEKEIEGCALLCANCHRLEHYLDL
jgi:hypothetical protein